MAKKETEDVLTSILSPKEQGERFFKENPDYAGSMVYVTSDGNVFHEGIRGKNYSLNHSFTLEDRKITEVSNPN